MYWSVARLLPYDTWTNGLYKTFEGVYDKTILSRPATPLNQAKNRFFIDFSTQHVLYMIFLLSHALLSRLKRGVESQFDKILHIHSI